MFVRFRLRVGAGNYVYVNAAQVVSVEPLAAGCFIQCVNSTVYHVAGEAQTVVAALNTALGRDEYSNSHE